MKKTMLLITGTLSILILTSTAWAAADITGFDGYKWGTKQSVIRKATGIEPKKQLNDHVTTIYHYNNPPEQSYKPQLKSKTFVFCEEKLCAGIVNLRLKAGGIVYGFTEKRIRAALGDKYGFRGDRNSVSTNQWVSKRGDVLIKEIDDHNITIWYRSPQYHASYKTYEKEIANEIKNKNLTPGFKF